jgi:hypothetical protein
VNPRKLQSVTGIRVECVSEPSLFELCSRFSREMEQIGTNS